MPLPPFDAVSAALPQKVPAPLTVTPAGNEFTVNVATLLSGMACVHPARVETDTVVTAVLPAVSSVKDCIGKLPVLPLIVSVSVYPNPELTPDKLYVTMKAPLPRLVELTVTVEPPP